MTLYLLVFLVVTFVFTVSNQCDHGEVMLVGGSGPSEGRVEICIASQWTRVCSAMWDDNDATVVCRQLGYSPHGATTSGTEFGQADGDAQYLSNVKCYPKINKALLECDSSGTSHADCGHDAGVKCMDEQRVKNVTACILNTSSTGSVHTVHVTWGQNTTVDDEPKSFKVECRNKQYSITTTVSSKTSITQLGGLLSFSYNCCVSAVYTLYEAKEICTGIRSNTCSNTITLSTENEISSMSTGNNQESNSTNLVNIVGGVLGFITLVLLVLLALSWIASLCLLRRKRFIAPRLTSVVERNQSTQLNLSHPITEAIPHSNKSATPTQVTSVTIGDKSSSNYTMLDPVYETIASDHSNQVLLSGKYELGDTQYNNIVESNSGVATEDSVFPGQGTENQDYAYAYLQ